MAVHILNRAPVPNDQCLVEVWIYAFSLGVQPYEVKHFPAAVNDVLDAEVEFAGHYTGVRFVGEEVEVFEADGVDFVVDVEAFDVGSVVAHYYVDELVDGC